MKKFPKALVLSTLFFALTASAHGGGPLQNADMLQQDNWMQQSEQSSNQHIHHVNANGKPGILVRARAKRLLRGAARDERKGNDIRAEYRNARAVELLEAKNAQHARRILKNEHIADQGRAANENLRADRYSSKPTIKGGQTVQENNVYYSQSGQMLQQGQMFQQSQSNSQWSQQEISAQTQISQGQLLSDTYEVYVEPAYEPVTMPPNGPGKDTVISDEDKPMECLNSSDDGCAITKPSYSKPIQVEQAVVYKPTYTKPIEIVKPIQIVKPVQELKPVQQTPVVVADPVIIPHKPTVPQKPQMTQKPKTEILKPRPVQVSAPLPEKLPLQAQVKPLQSQEGQLTQEVDCGKLGKSLAKRCNEAKIRRLGKRIARRDAKTDRLISKRDRLEADCLDSKLSKEVCVKQADDLVAQDNKAAKGLISKLFGAKSKHDKLENNPAVSNLTAQPMRTEIIPTGFGPQEIEVLPNSLANTSGAL